MGYDNLWNDEASQFDSGLCPELRFSSGLKPVHCAAFLVASSVVAGSELLERLGYEEGKRLVIIGCDDLGCCHAANAGIYEALRSGGATSASLMVPAPWARHAAANYRGEDVGVQLTFNAQYDVLRWGPITRAPSLLDGDGGFPRTVEDTWEHADSDEVYKEGRAQIERAIYWGFDVSHLGSHLDVLVRRPELFDVFAALAGDFGLPMRLPGPEAEAMTGFPFRRLARQAQAVFVDRVIATNQGSALAALEALGEICEPGVTELRVHPAADTPELRALAPDWQGRVAEAGFLARGAELRSHLAASGVELIGYRRLRSLLR